MKNLILTLLLLVPQIIGPARPAPDIEIVESIPVGTALDNPEIRNTREVWLEMIGGAGQTLDLEEYYISNEPGKMLEDILAAIFSAADRGVKVRVLVDARMYRTYPESVDKLSRRRNVEARRIDFGAIAGGMQHAKYFIVDGKEVFVGSQNFDWRALEHIHELGLRIRHEGIINIYRDVFMMDWTLAEKKADLTASTVGQQSYAVPFRVYDGISDSLIFFPTFSPRNWIPDS